MLFAMLIAGAVLSGVTTYDQAKAIADKDEASLTPKQSSTLVESQGKVISPAFAACMPSPQKPTLPAFTIVLKLDQSGRPQQTWRKGDSEFAKCVEQKLAAATFFRPPRSSFYTSFEFTFKP